MGRPYDWSPLTHEDPTPGNPTSIEQGSEHYGRIAVAIADARDALDDISVMDGYQSDAVATLRERAEEVRDHLKKVSARYEDASAALAGYATDLRAVQSSADGILDRAKELYVTYEDAQDSEAWWYRLARSAEAEGDPERAERYERLAREQGDRADAAWNEIVDLREGELVTVKQRRNNAAEDAMKAFDTLTSDGLNDGFWENYGSKIMGAISQIAGIVATVAGVLALVLCWVPVLGQALAAVALIATAVKLISDFVLAINGDQSWGEVGMGVVALATFGVGRVAVSAFRLATATRGLQSANRLANTSMSVSRTTTVSRTVLRTTTATPAGTVTRTVTQTTASVRQVTQLRMPTAVTYRQVLDATGGVKHLVGHALNPKLIIRETLEEAAPILKPTAFPGHFRDGVSQFAQSSAGSRLTNAFVGGDEAAMIANTNAERAAASSLLSNMGLSSAQSASVIGTSPLGLTGAGVAAVAGVDAIDTANSAVDLGVEISAPGFDFTSYITGQGDMRAAPERLNLD